MKTNMTQDKNMVFKHSVRILRCLIDCQEGLKDATAVLSALKLARCMQGRVWENTASELRQLSGIGAGMVRRFVNADVRSIRKLATLEAHQIETILSRNPPYGTKLLEQVKRIPNLTVSARLVEMQKVSSSPTGLLRHSLMTDSRGAKVILRCSRLWRKWDWKTQMPSAADALVLRMYRLSSWPRGQMGFSLRFIEFCTPSLIIFDSERLELTLS